MIGARAGKRTSDDSEAKRFRMDDLERFVRGKMSKGVHPTGVSHGQEDDCGDQCWRGAPQVVLSGEFFAPGLTCVIAAAKLVEAAALSATREQGPVVLAFGWSLPTKGVHAGESSREALSECGRVIDTRGACRMFIEQAFGGHRSVDCRCSVKVHDRVLDGSGDGSAHQNRLNL